MYGIETQPTFFTPPDPSTFLDPAAQAAQQMLAANTPPAMPTPAPAPTVTDAGPSFADEFLAFKKKQKAEADKAAKPDLTAPKGEPKKKALVGHLVTPAPQAAPPNPIDALKFQTLQDKLELKNAFNNKDLKAINEPEWLTLMRRGNDMQLDSLKDQSAGVDTQLKIARNIAADAPDLDMSPLARYTDSVTGSHLSIAKPTNPAVEAAQKLLENVQKTQKDRNSLTQEQVNLIKAQLGGYQLDQAARVALGLHVGTNQAKGGANPANQLGREFRKDQVPLMGKLAEVGQDYDQITEALKSNDLNRINPMLGRIARRISAERGVLTDPDIGRVAMKNFDMDTTRLMNYLGQPDARIDPKHLAPLIDMINRAKQLEYETYNKKIDDLDSTFKMDPNYEAAGIPTAVRAFKGRIKNDNPPQAPEKSFAQEFLDFKKNQKKGQ